MGAMARRDGFTLIEALIVVGILLILATVAIPPLLRNRVAANEASAVAALKALAVSEETYRAREGSYGSTASLDAALPIPYFSFSQFPMGRKFGYSFTMDLRTPAEAGFTARARPVRPGKDGKRRFFTDQTGIIRFHQRRDATSGDPDIE